MRLTCAFRTEFHKVEVVFNHRKQTRERDKLLSAVEHFGIKSNGVNEQVNPFFGGEILALVDVVLQRDVGNLYRLQVFYLPAHFDVFAC